MPERLRRLRVLAACTGRSSARLVPLPSTASGSPAAAAAATAAATSSSVPGARTAAVLPGQPAADPDAEREDVGPEAPRPPEALRVVGVEHDQRVQVAVAGV